MIRKILYLSIFIALSTAGVYSQSIIATPSASDTLTVDTTSTYQTESTLFYSLKNTTADTLSMNWVVTYTTLPHTWTVAVCDPNLCIGSSQLVVTHVYANSFVMLPNASSNMELEVTPTSGSDSGNFQILVWATGDSAATSTSLNFHLNLKANGVGITEVSAPTQVSVYPNPVRNELNVNLSQALSNGQVDVFNLLGGKVFSQAVSDKESARNLDLSGLESGIYIVRISDGNKIIATRKFTKVD